MAQQAWVQQLLLFKRDGGVLRFAELFLTQLPAFSPAFPHCSPKRFWLPLQVLLGPILPPVTSLFGWIADRAARRHNAAHGMPPRASS